MSEHYTIPTILLKPLLNHQERIIHHDPTHTQVWIQKRREGSLFRGNANPLKPNT